MSKHTPTPWQVRYEGSLCRLFRPGDDSLHEHSIAEFHNREDAMASENAEFIVRAVNAHEELVAALDGLLDLVETADLVRHTQNDGEFLKFFEQGVRIVERMKVAQQALAKARK